MLKTALFFSLALSDVSSAMAAVENSRELVTLADLEADLIAKENILKTARRKFGFVVLQAGGEALGSLAVHGLSLKYIPQDRSLHFGTKLLAILAAGHAVALAVNGGFELWLTKEDYEMVLETIRTKRAELEVIQ